MEIVKLDLDAELALCEKADNSDFIAAARTGYPAALAKLKRLREILKDVSTIRRMRQVSETAVCEDLLPLEQFNELRDLLQLP